MKNVIYKKVIRIAWFPTVSVYLLGAYCMRQYDNRVYDHFYFFE